jgi:hypothetical protein
MLRARCRRQRRPGPAGAEALEGAPRRRETVLPALQGPVAEEGRTALALVRPLV